MMAGLLYLLMMITAIFTEFYAHGQLIVRGDGLQTARNMVAYERLFRIGIASDLITFAGDVIISAGSLRCAQAYQPECGLTRGVLAACRIFHSGSHLVERFCSLTAFARYRLPASV